MCQCVSQSVSVCAWMALCFSTRRQYSHGDLIARWSHPQRATPAHLRSTRNIVLAISHGGRLQIHTPPPTHHLKFAVCQLTGLVIELRVCVCVSQQAKQRASEFYFSWLKLNRRTLRVSSDHTFQLLLYIWYMLIERFRVSVCLCVKWKYF